jgi:hypothetical protein
MIGESTLNEYKAYKNLVKHKKRINRVFSEVGAEIAFRSRPPGIDKKALAVAMVSCSAAPPKLLEERKEQHIWHFFFYGSSRQDEVFKVEQTEVQNI